MHGRRAPENRTNRPPRKLVHATEACAPGPLGDCQGYAPRLFCLDLLIGDATDDEQVGRPAEIIELSIQLLITRELDDASAPLA
jgi:hypothetical protein